MHIVRPAKRIAVLVPGLIIAYFSVDKVFPYFEKRLPLGFAVFTTYVIGAYVLVPALIRLYRIFVPAKHLPLYCVTPDGFASDPLNIGIISTRLELIQSMEKSGWFVADPHHGRYLLKHLLSTFFEREYATAPMSNLYLFGRKHDVGFEIPLDGGSGNRHHVRFWATTYESGQKVSFNTIHWHNRKKHVSSDSLLWVGAASRDTGFGVIRHNLQLTHMINPDTNAERELIVQKLQAAKLVSKVATIKLDKPYRLINRVWTGSLHSDGKMAIVTLKSNSLK